MILHSTLLCCAAYEGDISMVEQLLQTTRACPNALGLKLVYTAYHETSYDVPVDTRMHYTMHHLLGMKP